MRCWVGHLVFVGSCLAACPTAGVGQESPPAAVAASSHVAVSANDGEAWPPWDNARLQGSPEPPRPFTVARAFPRLKLDWPVCLRRIPDRPYYLAIHEDGPYSPAYLAWFDDDQGASQAHRLLSFDNVAYDIAFHPDFKLNGYCYIGSAEPAHPDGARCLITRYTLRSGPSDEGVTIEPESARTIIAWPSNGHNGAAVAFGPDGMLYVTTGDGTVRRDTDEVGQRLDTLRSKVLRIDVDHPDAGKMYSVPVNNPFVDTPGAMPETWCYGLRNPWRISIDAASGQIWVGNNGQDAWEQVYLIQRGGNYGWSVYEGGHLFIADRQPGPTPILPPTFEHPHSEARSLTGGLVYRGRRHASLIGAYLYGDYSTGKIWAGKHDGSQVLWRRELADTSLNITCFTSDASGELLVADHRGDGLGGFYRLIPNPKAGQPTSFPGRLSETGLFQDTAALRPAAGVAPYRIRAAAWHDGARSRYWLALPAATDDPTRVAPIQFHRTNPWGFPDGAALVQTLSTPGGEQVPPRRLETRVLLKQDGEWAGYSYLWRPDQQDADLAPAGGASASLPPASFGSQDPRLTWRTPSRSECMACHSRAANYVLGVRTSQLHRIKRTQREADDPADDPGRSGGDVGRRPD